MKKEEGREGGEGFLLGYGPTNLIAMKKEEGRVGGRKEGTLWNLFKSKQCCEEVSGKFCK